jgi:hypothetical protein
VSGFRRGRSNLVDGSLACGLPNLFTKTEDFSSATWIKQGIGVASPVVTADAALAPDGTMTADQVDFVAAGAGQTCGLYQEISQSGGVFTFSLYVKGVSGSGSIFLLIYDGSFVPPIAIPFTTSWNRVAVRVPAAGTLNSNVATDFELGFSDAWSGGAGGGASLNMWGAMLNAGAKACRYKKVA